MSKMIILYILLYFVINHVYAMPLLWVVPFVFDFWMLFLVFILGIMNGIMFYMFKKMSILNLMLFLLNMMFLLILYYIIWYSWFLNINLSLMNWYYVKFYFMFFLLISLIIFLFKMNKKLYKNFMNYFMLFFLIMLSSMLMNMLFSMYNMYSYYNNVMDKLNKETNNSVEFTSNLIFNNMLVSSDLKYKYNWNYDNCSITMSYYKHTNNLWAYAINAPKTYSIHLYTWLSSSINWESLCSYLIEK